MRYLKRLPFFLCAVCAGVLFAAQPLEPVLEGSGPYEVAALNAAAFIGNNHVYKHKPARNTRIPELTDKAVFKNPLTVFYPAAAGVYPLVIIGHGWGDSKRPNAGLARYLASHGYVTVIFSAKARRYPEDFPAAFAAAYRLLKDAGENPAGLLYQRLDMGRTAVIGHSMGGTAALHFVQQHTGIHTVIALNPYNGASRFIEMVGGKNTVLGADLSQLNIPVLIFTGSNDKIAYPEKTFEFYRGCNPAIPAAFFSIKDGMHISGMDKIGNTVTGRFDAEKHLRIRYLILCWLELFLKNDSSRAALLYAVPENAAAVAEWFFSHDKGLYPPYSFRNLPIP
ncbi:MAG: alpha/beta hydrolase [Treponema sp.]